MLDSPQARIEQLRQSVRMLEAQRAINAPWDDHGWASDTVMIHADPAVTSIDLTSAAAFQVAQGSIVSDSDGERQARLQTLLERVKAELRAGRPAMLWHAFTAAEWDVVCGYDEEPRTTAGLLREFADRSLESSCDFLTTSLQQPRCSDADLTEERHRDKLALGKAPPHIHKVCWNNRHSGHFFHQVRDTGPKLSNLLP